MQNKRKTHSVELLEKIQIHLTLYNTECKGIYITTSSGFTSNPTMPFINSSGGRATGLIYTCQAGGHGFDYRCLPQFRIVWIIIPACWLLD